MPRDWLSDIPYEPELDRELDNRHIVVPDRIKNMSDASKRRDKKRQLIRDYDRIYRRQQRRYTVLVIGVLIGILLITVLVAGILTRWGFGFPAKAETPGNGSGSMAMSTSKTVPQPTLTPYPVEPTYTPYPNQPTYTAIPTQIALTVQPPVSESIGNSDSLASLMQNPYMLAYQDTLQYTVPVSYSIISNLNGFLPVPSLVSGPFQFNRSNDGKEIIIDIPTPPSDVTPWYCFPQDYSVSDQFNPGCAKLQEEGKLPWTTPIAGYNDGENWSCDSPDGWCADDIQAQNWRVIDGYEVCHPAVGCVKDPDGGAAMILIINFHDSDEVWGPRNNSAIYVDNGFIGYGVMWDLSGVTYDIGKGIADIRNHYLYNLGYDVSSSDNHLRGQCGDSDLCKTVTYVVVARVWDRPELGINFSHFELLDFGQWIRP
jgi:hypothetical protein